MAAESHSVSGWGMVVVLTSVVTLSEVEALPLFLVVKVMLVMISVPVSHVTEIGDFHQTLKKTVEV